MVDEVVVSVSGFPNWHDGARDETECEDDAMTQFEFSRRRVLVARIRQKPKAIKP